MVMTLTLYDRCDDKLYRKHTGKNTVYVDTLWPKVCGQWNNITPTTLEI